MFPATFSIGTCFLEGNERCHRLPNSAISFALPIAFALTVKRASDLMRRFETKERRGRFTKNASRLRTARIVKQISHLGIERLAFELTCVR